MHPGDLEHCGYVVDARPMCSGDPDCAGSPNAPYCELTGGVCVECYNDTQCAGKPETPFCDETTFLCTSCITNMDCPSGVCLPTGVCGDDASVAYVDPAMGTDNADCKQLTPCKTIDAALLTKKPFVHLKGMLKEAVVVDGQTVTFVAEPGTTLTVMGVVITVTHGADLSIYGLTIIGNGEKGIVADMNSTLRLTGVTVTGCDMHDKRAIEIKNATFLMSRSTVHSNGGGGVLADANAIYQITNSFIYRNGADDSAVGGLSLASSNPLFNRFELNTIVDNRAKTAAGGVQCASSQAAPNNIIVRNYSAGLNLATTQTGLTPSCNFAESLQGTDVEPFAFVMPDGTGPWDYHITAGSMAIDRGVASEVHIDFDGEMRPMGPKIDVGADEFPQ